MLNGDEWRAMDNLNPIPGGKGKIFWQPANMLELGAKPAPPPPPPAAGEDDDEDAADSEDEAEEMDDETNTTE